MSEINHQNVNAWLQEQPFHPQRETLTQELHARPFEALATPCEVFLFAKITTEQATEQEFAHLATFCQRNQLQAPPKNIRHYTVTHSQYRLRWERHGEFTTCALFMTPQQEHPFTTSPVKEVLEWFSSTEGQLLVATQLSVQSSKFESSEEVLSTLFEKESLVSALLSEDEAHVWTDLRIHKSGFNRILLINNSMSAIKLGRNVQYLLDIATYRNMALLALPVAQEISHKIADIDDQLSALLGRISDTDILRLTVAEAINVDSELHERLSELAMAIQLLNTQSSFRLNGSKAYYAIIKSRIMELDEHSVAGYQTIGEFIRRRLDPAMRTCDSIEKRLDDIAKRTARVVDLLRTRLDLTIEKQNHQLLGSMNDRARMQMNLQETIEGVSIAAITYYIVGLISYTTKSLAKLGLDIQPELVAGFTVIPVALTVWYGVKQVKKRIRRNTNAA